MSAPPWVVPAAVRQQAQWMADDTRQPHYIVREGGSWLITPDAQPVATVVRPMSRRNARRVWA